MLFRSRRIETVGFYNGTIKSNSGRIDRGRASSGRDNQARGREDTDSSGQSSQRAAREVAEGSNGRTGPISSDEQTGLKFSISAKHEFSGNQKTADDLITMHMLTLIGHDQSPINAGF